MCIGLISFYWVLPSCKVSYLDTKEEDSSSIKPLYHKKQAKRQETDLPPNLSRKKRACTCAGRGSGLAIVTQTRGSIDPSYLRGSRTEGREQGSATTCRYDRLRRARRQQVSGRQNTSSWLAPPRAPGISSAKTLHALPCTDFSPTEAFLHKPVFFENLLTFEYFYSLSVIENTLS